MGADTNVPRKKKATRIARSLSIALAVARQLYPSEYPTRQRGRDCVLPSIRCVNQLWKCEKRTIPCTFGFPLTDCPCDKHWENNTNQRTKTNRLWTLLFFSRFIVYIHWDCRRGWCCGKVQFLPITRSSRPFDLPCEQSWKSAVYRDKVPFTERRAIDWSRVF